MWIIFGWEKKEKPLGDCMTTYCYDCRRNTEWVVWNESEWVTFSDIRILRFVYKHRVHCDTCTFFMELESRDFRRINKHMKRHDSIDGTKLGAALTSRIEKAQLATKTPQQLKYIRESMEAIQEYEAAMRRQNGSDS